MNLSACVSESACAKGGGKARAFRWEQVQAARQPRRRQKGAAAQHSTAQLRLSCARAPVGLLRHRARLVRERGPLGSRRELLSAHAGWGVVVGGVLVMAGAEGRCARRRQERAPRAPARRQRAHGATQHKRSGRGRDASRKEIKQAIATHGFLQEWKPSALKQLTIREATPRKPLTAAFTNILN